MGFRDHGSELVDLRHRTSIGRYRVVHADPFETWQRSSINLRDFQFQISQDGQKGLTLDSITDNLADVTDRPVTVPTTIAMCVCM